MVYGVWGSNLTDWSGSVHKRFDDVTHLTHLSLDFDSRTWLARNCNAHANAQSLGPDWRDVTCLTTDDE
jgi:hypothetical protein